MKALTITSPPDVDSLSLIECDIPRPGPGEALVKISSIGLNRGDLLFCQNRYFHKPSPGSRVGFEGAGTIVALGDAPPSDDVINIWKVGDRVATCPMSFDANTQGCLAEYSIFKYDQLIPSPKSVEDHASGAIWMAYLTAWGGMVEAGQLQQGENVVITAASSSVGLAAIQIANMLGAKSIATTSSEEKAKALYDLGAQHVIVQARDDETYENYYENYVEQLYDITNRQGSDLVFDAVAGPATRGLVKGSKRGARIVIQGMLDRRPMDIHAGVLMKRLLTLKGYTLDQTLENPEQKARALETLKKGFEDGSLKPEIGSYYALTNYAKAFSELARNRHIGKIVVVPE